MVLNRNIFKLINLEKRTGKVIINNLIATLFGLLSTGFIFECLARILPVSDSISVELPIKCQKNSTLNINCFHRKRAFSKIRYTKGAFPPYPINVIKNTNDIGQFSDTKLSEFIRLIPKKISILSVGDSYVEARQVNNTEAFHGLLSKIKIKNKVGNELKEIGINSTAIGSMGYSFPHYIKALEYVDIQKSLEKSYVVIPIISNDFETSFRKYSNIAAKGYFFFESNSKEISFDPYLIDIKSKIKRTIINNSAFARYILINLDGRLLFYKYPLCLLWRECETRKIAANIVDADPIIDAERYKDGFKSSDIFLYHLKKLRVSPLERKRTIILLDADRQNIYDKNVEKNKYLVEQKNYLSKLLLDNGFSVIDLEEDFRKDYDLNKRKFEFVNDAHWNSLGHKVVAKSIADKVTKIETMQVK